MYSHTRHKTKALWKTIINTNKELPKVHENVHTPSQQYDLVFISYFHSGNNWHSDVTSGGVRHRTIFLCIRRAWAWYEF